MLAFQVSTQIRLIVILITQQWLILLPPERTEKLPFLCTSGVSTTGSDAQRSGVRSRRSENTEMVKTKTNSSLHI